MPQPSFADVVERLMAQFEGRVSAATVADVVMECRRELRRVGANPRPEEIERLAEQRLHELATRGPPGSPPSPA